MKKKALTFKQRCKATADRIRMEMACRNEALRWKPEHGLWPPEARFISVWPSTPRDCMEKIRALYPEAQAAEIIRELGWEE